MTEIRAAGDFNLASAEILTSSGTLINIKTNISQINIYEDCGRNSISGEMLMHDSGGFVSVGPIMGQEYLSLKLQTSSLTDENDVIDFTENVFLINSIDNRTEVGNNVSVYLVSFTSSELVKNQRTRINKSLVGSFSDIVRQMFETVNCKKKVFIEPTRGIKRMVLPNISPFDVINLAAKQATSNYNVNYSPNYLFFETFKGYHFRSLSSLYSQPIVQTYETFIPGTQANLFVGSKSGKKGFVAIERELAMILGYEIIENNDSLFNYTTGVLGSKLISHNIYTKSFKRYDYNYFDNFGKEDHIEKYHSKEQHPIFSDVSIENGGLRGSDFPSRTYLTSISKAENDVNNTTVNNTEPYAAPDPENSLQERVSTLNQLNKGLLLNIIVHGNTSVNAGDIVKVDIPLTSAYKVPEEEGLDRFYQGAFLIKRIKHSFDFGEKKHKSILTLVKDSLPKKLEGPKNQVEPKPKKSINVISRKDVFYPQL